MCQFFVAVIGFTLVGASDCTRTQFADVAEQMYVKIGGVQAYGRYSNPQITVVISCLKYCFLEFNPAVEIQFTAFIMISVSIHITHPFLCSSLGITIQRHNLRFAIHTIDGNDATKIKYYQELISNPFQY